MSVFNPLDYPSCFMLPTRKAHSHWTEHVPFAMAVVEMTRPRVLIELGAYCGVSYCAFCQAIDHLGISTRAFAVDTWEGDPHNGINGPEVLADLKSFHDSRYLCFSRLIKSTFDDALDHFGDGTVDLLHIDGYHTYDAVAHDFNQWLPKMSDRGVILFHDTNVHEMDFGVWRLWAEVNQRYPSFEFTHEHGLGMIAVGSVVPDALRPLFEATPVEIPRIRQFYHHLGRRIRIQWEKEELHDRIQIESQELTRAAVRDMEKQQEAARLKWVEEHQAVIRQWEAARDQWLADHRQAENNWREYTTEELAKAQATREELVEALTKQHAAAWRHLHDEHVLAIAETKRTAELHFAEEQKRVLDAHRKEVERYEEQLAETEQRAQLFRLQVAEKNDLLHALGTEFQRQADELRTAQALRANLQTRVAELETERAGLSAALEAVNGPKDVTIHTLRLDIHKKNEEIVRLEASINQLIAERREFENSLTYRSVDRMSRLLRWLAPQGSLRRSSLKLVRKSGGILYREGFGSLVRRGANRLFGARKAA